MATKNKIEEYFLQEISSPDEKLVHSQWCGTYTAESYEEAIEMYYTEMGGLEPVRVLVEIVGKRQSAKIFKVSKTVNAVEE